MTDYISRQAAIDAVCKACSFICDEERDGRREGSDLCAELTVLRNVPSTDVVSRDCYDAILWENDIMRKQLAEIGKTPGAKMDDVRSVRSGAWEHVKGVCTPGGDPWLICPFCHDKDSEHLGGIEMPKKWNWCPVCGAMLSD